MAIGQREAFKRSAKQCCMANTPHNKRDNMWSIEGKTAKVSANIYENHTAQAVLVTDLVHNDAKGDKQNVITVPSSGQIKLSAEQSMAFTCLIERSRAIRVTENAVSVSLFTERKVSSR